MMPRLTAEWWTPADVAELDLLTDALVDAVFAHRERCSTCRAGGPWCASLRAAFEALLAWRRRRILHSRANWLRACETEAAA